MVGCSEQKTQNLRLSSRTTEFADTNRVLPVLPQGPSREGQLGVSSCMHPPRGKHEVLLQVPDENPVERRGKMRGVPGYAKYVNKIVALTFGG